MRVLALLLLTASVAVAQSGATYEVTFTATWSAATHPDGFPSNPHFSPLIGAAHDADVALWTVGETATAGIESMAETGSTTALRGEVDAHAQAGRIARVLGGGNLAVSPGTTTMAIDLDDDAPLVSLVTMLAPSPDWFVGVSGLDLREDGTWATERTVDLFLYDAGTDDGESYTSANADSAPKQPIARVEADPFLVNGAPAPLGTFTFRRTAVSTPDGPETGSLEIVPNPASGPARLRLGGEARQAEVRVVDVRGREVFTAAMAVPAGGTEAVLPTEEWAPGAYVVHVQSGTSIDMRMLTVVR